MVVGQGKRLLEIKALVSQHPEEAFGVPDGGSGGTCRPCVPTEPALPALASTTDQMLHFLWLHVHLHHVSHGGRQGRCRVTREQVVDDEIYSFKPPCRFPQRACRQ